MWLKRKAWDFRSRVSAPSFHCLRAL
jgi:hypothetical protein